MLTKVFDFMRVIYFIISYFHLFSICVGYVSTILAGNEIYLWRYRSGNVTYENVLLFRKFLFTNVLFEKESFCFILKFDLNFVNDNKKHFTIHILSCAFCTIIICERKTFTC
jgi:hypothetical protein